MFCNLSGFYLFSFFEVVKEANNLNNFIVNCGGFILSNTQQWGISWGQIKVGQEIPVVGIPSGNYR